MASDKKRKDIVADYIECNNYSEVARKYNVSVDTVRRYVREDKDFVNNLKQKKQENSCFLRLYFFSFICGNSTTSLIDG